MTEQEAPSRKRMRMRCEKILGNELEPGDLFSTAGPDWWNHVDESGSIGEKVYIRTSAPGEQAPDGHLPIFRIHIEGVEDD